MYDTSKALGSSPFALLQASGSEDFGFALVCLFFVAIVLWENWPRLKGLLPVGKMGLSRLRYEQDGRSGRIYFENGRSRFDMYWEFGGGDVLAIIDVPSENEWTAQTGLPVSERMEVLSFIAKEVIRDKTSTGRNRYEIGPSEIRIFD